MKLNSTEQKEVNDFFRNFVNPAYKNPMNCVRLNVDHTDSHRKRIFDVCNVLLKHRIPFWTEVRLNNGCVPDIICPTHVKKIIEVLSSETEEMFYQNKYPKYESGLQNEFILVSTSNNFEEKEIF